MNQNVREQTEKTIIILNDFVQKKLKNGGPTEEIEILPSIINGLSQFINALNNVDYKKKLTKSSRPNLLD